MKTELADLDLGGSAGRRRHLMMRRIAQLVFLAVTADLAVLLAEFVSGVDPLVDFHQHPFLYLYLFLGTIVAFGVFGALLGSREALLKEMALRDSLTGLLNSRYLHVRLQEELASAKRHERPTSIVLFDIDHFKKVNDKYGHPVGDQALQLIGKTIQSTLREGEIAARVGGEEFALLLPSTSAELAAAAAERIRRSVGEVAVRTKNDQALTVTMSAGVACANHYDAQDAAALYSRADQALYRAKEQGRDRVIVETTIDLFPIRPNDGLVEGTRSRGPR